MLDLCEIAHLIIGGENGFPDAIGFELARDGDWRLVARGDEPIDTVSKLGHLVVIDREVVARLPDGFQSAGRFVGGRRGGGQSLRSAPSRWGGHD